MPSASRRPTAPTTGEDGAKPSRVGVDDERQLDAEAREHDARRRPRRRTEDEVRVAAPRGTGAQQQVLLSAAREADHARAVHERGDVDLPQGSEGRVRTAGRDEERVALDRAGSARVGSVVGGVPHGPVPRAVGPALVEVRAAEREAGVRARRADGDAIARDRDRRAEASLLVRLVRAERVDVPVDARRVAPEHLDLADRAERDELRGHRGERLAVEVDDAAEPPVGVPADDLLVERPRALLVAAVDPDAPERHRGVRERIDGVVEEVARDGDGVAMEVDRDHPHRRAGGVDQWEAGRVDEPAVRTLLEDVDPGGPRVRRRRVLLPVGQRDESPVHQVEGVAEETRSGGGRHDQLRLAPLPRTHTLVRLERVASVGRNDAGRAFEHDVGAESHVRGPRGVEVGLHPGTRVVAFVEGHGARVRTRGAVVRSSERESVTVDVEARSRSDDGRSDVLPEEGVGRLDHGVLRRELRTEVGRRQGEDHRNCKKRRELHGEPSWEELPSRGTVDDEDPMRAAAGCRDPSGAERAGRTGKGPRGR
ncbi:MAG: hypothetical protein R3F34_07195 [Planctomycetota bacterium]